MKVAVCLSGHVRSFHQTISTLLACIDDVDADFFVHTWDNFGNTANWASPIDYTTPVPPDYVHQFINPTKIVIEKQSEVDLSYDGPITYKPWPLHDQIKVDRVLGMLYKVWACDQLRQQHENENSFTYDAVVRLRMDLLVFKCGVSKLKDKLADDVLFVPSKDEGLVGEMITYPDVMPDKLAVGNSKTMTKFCSHWPLVRGYIRDGVYMHGEGISRYHLNKENIKMVLTPELHGRILR
jgi:hypothetical protein